MITEILKESKEIVFDSGVLIAYLAKEGNLPEELLDTFIFSKTTKTMLYIHELAKTEVFYIFCRKKGKDDARKIFNLVETFSRTIKLTLLSQIAGEIKCLFPIALADCYTIACGIFKSCPVFFMPEQELENEIIDRINDEFKSEIYLFT
jgi:predicted nucleic acid-binding protein